MSDPTGTNRENEQADIPESELADIQVEGIKSDGHPEMDSAHYDDYTTLLRKHLSVVEGELSRLKGTPSNKPNSIVANDDALESTKSDQGTHAQEARIYRVPPWEWREVKSGQAIDPKLPTLIVSSKGYGRVRRRPLGRTITTTNFKPPGSGSLNEGEPCSDIAYRVAINSRILLNLLGACTGMDFPEDRNVWLRPFKYLVAYETEIKQALRDAEVGYDQLKAESGSSDPADTIQAHDESGILATKPMHKRGDVDVDSTIEASRVQAERDQLRCLVEFMGSDMEDIFDVKRRVDDRTLEEITFENLWLLYTPGDLIYRNETPEGRSTYQAYRVLHVTGGRPVLDTLNESRFNTIQGREWEEESETEEKARDTIRGSSSSITPLIIDCFSVDFDGFRIGPKSRRFVVPAFTGKRRVDALEVYPAFSLPDHEKLRDELVERGRRFTQLANGTHKKYSGTTLREGRELWEMSLSYWNYTIHAEEVHSEVIIDQSAAVAHYRKHFDKWRLKIGGRIVGVPTTADRREIFDPLPTDYDGSAHSDVFDDSVIDLDRRKDFINSTTLLSYHRNILDSSLSDDYVMLLPYRIYGYAMLRRKWFPLNINLVSDITLGQVQMTAAGYEDLVLPDGHKKLLQAIVKNQVRDAKQECRGQKEDPDEFQMDVVKGKGKGLIILLHGAPGVGKTSTAECVAAQLRRPLLPITCGDVSTNVKDAEETLQEFCRLADRWKCVLLLDEADVFLAKREKGDLNRNGLVSVFLRVLEYFSGVIILTTNRVGEFDEAFRSRIHVSLYYPKLDRDATLQIWERSLMRIRKSGLQVDFSEDEIREFAEQHWLDNVAKPSRHWNGRQIKNAFQTALALANWEFYETKQGQSLERPLLKAKHLKSVAKTSAHFDDYISDVYNISDDTFSVLAARDEIRKDTHPAMSLGRSDTQGFVPRSRRAAPARRGADTRNAEAGEGRRSEGGSKDSRVRQLELELELMKLKQASGKEEVQAAQDGKDDEEEEEQW